MRNKPIPEIKKQIPFFFSKQKRKKKGVFYYRENQEKHKRRKKALWHRHLIDPSEKKKPFPILNLPSTISWKQTRKENWEKKEKRVIHFFRVSISAPIRRAALTFFSSFLAAALRGFFRSTTGSQSCVRGPIPAILDLLPVSRARERCPFYNFARVCVRGSNYPI